MSVPGMISPFEEARKKISKDELKEGLRLLEEALGEVVMAESVKRGFHNTMVVFLARYNRVQKERSIRTPEYYDMQLNGLAMDVLELIGLVEEEVGKEAPIEISEKPFRVELIVDIDFDGERDEELEELLTGIATVIRINPGAFTIVSQKTQSVTVETDLSTEQILKIKSIVRIYGEELSNIRIEGFGESKDWTEENINIYLPHCELSNAFLEGKNLTKANFCKANLSEAELSEANLSGADLSGADLSNADLSDANLNGADLSEADLSDANLNRANLRGANLRGANLNKANLVSANLRWANLSGADLSEASLNFAKLTGANLKEGNLQWAELFCTDLEKANLHNANLMEADLKGANLRSANLYGANLIEAELIDEENFQSNKNMDQKVPCYEVNLDKADLREAIFFIDQTAILEEMNIDISEVIFVDDKGRNVKNGEVVFFIPPND